MMKRKNDGDYSSDFETFFSWEILLLAMNDVSFSWIYVVHDPRQNTRCLQLINNQ